MSKEQYSQLGFNSLPEPDAFDQNDTTNPLEGYKPSILSEIYMGQGNYSKGDACEAYIMENAKDYENLTMKNSKIISFLILTDIIMIKLMAENGSIRHLLHEA